jgi:RNA polymerase sigma-70 factor (ECF subfamily)
MKVSDDLLVRLLKDKNAKAYTYLFNRYYKVLTTQASYILKDKMEAEDQVQNLFVEIIDGKLGVNVNFSLQAYLKTCVYHKCLMVLNKDKRHKKYLDQYSGSVSPAVTYDYFQRPESQSNIDQLLKGLSIQRLQVCKLVYLEHKKYKEAAVEMGITINSVKTHLRLANKNLKDRLIDSRMQTQVLKLLYA